MLQDPKRANGQATIGQGHSTTTKPTRKANEPIPYDEAVKEGRALRKEQNGTERRIQLRLGELAARVETKYADRTLAKFAKEHRLQIILHLGALSQRLREMGRHGNYGPGAGFVFGDSSIGGAPGPRTNRPG